MRDRRGCERDEDIASGPAKLCHALQIGPNFDAWDLTRGSRLWIAEDRCRGFTVAASPRIGVSAAQHRPWRFFIDGNRHVSGPRRFHTMAKSSLKRD